MTCDDETSDSCVDPSAVSSDGTGARLKTKVTAESARVGVVERSRDRARMDRATVFARCTPAPRPPPMCVDRARFPIHIRSSSRIHHRLGIVASTSRVESTRRE